MGLRDLGDLAEDSIDGNDEGSLLLFGGCLLHLLIVPVQFRKESFSELDRLGFQPLLP